MAGDNFFKKLNSLYVYSKKHIPIEFLKKIGFKNATRENIWTAFVASSILMLTVGTGWTATLYLRSYFAPELFYMLFVLIVILNTWGADFRIGIVASTISAAGLIYLLPPEGIASWVTLPLFLIVSLVISFLIHTARQTDNIRRYKMKEEEYARALIQLRRHYNKAQDEIRARDEFLSIASHELKIPLTSMLLQLQRMLYGIRTISLAKFSIQELTQVLENAENQIKKLSKMINDLLSVSLITTGRIDLDREKLNLTRLVTETVENFKDLFEQDSYKVKLEAEKAVYGRFDRVRIEQVLFNILSNAIKYGNGKPIRIKVWQTARGARLLIEDQGIGIPKEKLNILFEKFGRAVSNREKKGLGVGLYIAGQIIKAHGGDIKVNSKPGRGTSFLIELPFQS